jgi:DNA modification methylase
VGATQQKVKHPARYSNSIIDVMAEVIEPGALVFDPFAGTGKIFDCLPEIDWVGMEIEKEWADLHPNTLHGDIFTDIPPWWREFFDWIATSPCYGNRYADNHNPKDGSERRGYKHDLGHDLQPANSGQLQWGESYRLFHEQAWTLIVGLLAKRGKLVVNISNHIRDFEEQHVWEWHVDFLINNCGLVLRKVIPIDTPRNRKGKNYKARVNCEYVFVFEKVA